MRRDETFEREFPALYQRALGVAARVVGSGDPAEDVAAEALARTFVHWAKVLRVRRRLPPLSAGAGGDSGT